MSRLPASAILWSSFSASRNSRRFHYRDSPREAMHVPDPVQLLFDSLPQHRIVDDVENEQRYRDLSEGLQCPIQRVLLRIKVKSAKQVRGRHFLPLNGCDQAQD